MCRVFLMLILFSRLYLLFCSLIFIYVFTYSCRVCFLLVFFLFLIFCLFCWFVGLRFFFFICFDLLSWPVPFRSVLFFSVRFCMCRKFCVVFPVSCGVFPASWCFRPVSCVRAVLLHVRPRPVCPHDVRSCRTFPCRAVCVPVEESIPVLCRVCTC